MVFLWVTCHFCGYSCYPLFSVHIFSCLIFSLSITKVEDFFIALRCICWHLLAAASLSLRLSWSCFTGIATAIALIFLLHLLQELLPLHIPLCLCVCTFYSYVLGFFRLEFFPQKWQLTLAFNRTDLLLVRFRDSPVKPREAQYFNTPYPLLRLRFICLYVHLKASCNCRLYYHRNDDLGRCDCGFLLHRQCSPIKCSLPDPLCLVVSPKIVWEKIRIQLKWQGLWSFTHECIQKIRKILTFVGNKEEFVDTLLSTDYIHYFLLVSL